MEEVYAVQEVTPIDCRKSSYLLDLVKDICGDCEIFSLHRFCILMRKMGAKWLIREEELLPNEALKKEINAIKLRCDNNPTCEFERITVFGDVEQEKIFQEDSSKHLLGYAIIGKVIFEKQSNTPIDNKFYIFESVVRFPSRVLPLSNSQHRTSFARIPITNYYYHCASKFETTIGTESKHTHYSINGTYFAQQNDLTSVCAHASLQTAINNAPYLQVKKITSEDINEILSIDHLTPQTRVGHFGLNTSGNYQTSISKNLLYRIIQNLYQVAKNFPNKMIKNSSGARCAGLTSLEIIKVTEALGLNALFADFLKPKSVECYKWIYPQIESCFPTIIGIQRKKIPRKTPYLDHKEKKPFSHVVTALGHTMNSDRWEPEARSGYKESVVPPYYLTCDWVDHFIINDDNLGMGRALATEQLRDTNFRKKNYRLHASMAVSIVPKEISSPGINAELLASAIIDTFIKDFKKKLEKGNQLLKWQEELAKNKISCRTFACDKHSYMKHLLNSKDNFGNNISQENIKLINNALSTIIWATEISIPNLLRGNKSKLGDVLCKTAFKYTGDISRDLKAVEFVWLPGIAVLDLPQQRELEKWPLQGYIPLQEQTKFNHKRMEW